MLDGALTSFTLCDAYHDITPHAQWLASQIRSRIEYIIIGDNIIVFDWSFDWKKKLISFAAVNTILIQFIDL